MDVVDRSKGSRLIALAAITGLLAAWGVQKASEGWSGFSRWAEHLPYVSAMLVGAIGVIVTLRGLVATGFL